MLNLIRALRDRQAIRFLLRNRYCKQCGSEMGLRVIRPSTQYDPRTGEARSFEVITRCRLNGDWHSAGSIMYVHSQTASRGRRI